MVAHGLNTSLVALNSREPVKNDATLAERLSPSPNASQLKAGKRETFSESEMTHALGIVVTAFIDISFGTSPPQHAIKAANDNGSMPQLVERFTKNTSSKANQNER